MSLQPRAGPTAPLRDCETFNGSGDPGEARLLRRVHERRHAVFAGLHETQPGMAVRTPGSFGSPGAGGPFGYADPQAAIGYGYVTNQMGTSLTGIHETWRYEMRCRRSRVDVRSGF
jgi:CubicO group peptidase (beta-lactamase class C family)